ncbi:AMP-binding protein [Kribbella sp. NPDC055071]
MTFAHPVNSGHRVDINPATAVARNARYYPGTLAAVYSGGDLTFAQLDDKVARCARVLVDRGVELGDRVAFLGMNSTSFLVTMLAAFRVGAIFVPVNFRLAAPELARVLARSGATLIVSEQGHRAVTDAVSGSTALRRFLLVDDDPEIPAEPADEQWEGWRDLLAAATPWTGNEPRTFDDPAILMFTSGTTGTPKGVVLTFGNAWWNSVNVEWMVDSRRGDVTHAVAPIFHIGALNSFVLRSLVRGGTVVLRRSFDPELWLKDLVEYRVNNLFAVPAMLQALGRVAGIFAADLSALRTVVVAAAPVPLSLIESYAQHGVLLQQAWGLTETAPFATHLPAEWTLDKAGSAGIPMPYTQIGIVDVHDGSVLPVGVAGEIVVRGPNVTPGYWEDPAATAAAFDADGWFHSGDIGYQDEDGCLYIVDRLKDMIITGGENVYPAEVESALADLPGLTDVAVIGRPDPKWGEAVVAMISVEPGARPSLEDVREYAGRRLARYKLPTALEIVEVVPRNASGKLDKVALRALPGSK